jgi:hypothetical protein
LAPKIGISIDVNHRMMGSGVHSFMNLPLGSSFLVFSVLAAHLYAYKYSIPLKAKGLHGEVAIKNP